MFELDDDKEAFIAIVAAGIFIFRPAACENGVFTLKGEKEAAEEAVAQAKSFAEILEKEMGP